MRELASRVPLMGQPAHGGPESWKRPQSPCSKCTLARYLAFFWDPSQGRKPLLRKKHNEFYRANSVRKSMFRGRCKCSYRKYLRASMGGHRGGDSQFKPNLHIFPFLQKEDENSEGKIWSLVWIPGQKREKENKKHKMKPSSQIKLLP